MLQSIRDRLTGPIVWFVVFLISVPFAFWGIQQFKGDQKAKPVAKVGDVEITQAQYQDAYKQSYQRLQQLYGDAFQPDLIDQKQFRKSVLDDLVTEAVLKKKSQDEGFTASDAELMKFLKTIPAFQKDGKFSPETYRNVLAMNGRTPESVEADLRKSLAVEQLRSSIVDTAFATVPETYQVYRLAKEERDYALLDFDLKSFSAKADVTDEQVKAQYDQHPEAYQAPERLKVAYIDLDQSKLPESADPGDETLKTVYEAQKNSRFATPEQRHARHIMIRFGDDKQAALKKIQALADKIKNGESFEQVAKESSEDADTRDQGGDLGWLLPEAMPPAFDKELFSMKAGETSAPVETEFGYHLIHLDDIRPAAVKAFTDPGVRDDVLALWRASDRQHQFQDLSDKIEKLAFENPGSLQQAADAAGLKIETSDWFTREQGTGIAGDDAVRKAAFDSDILKDEENSRPIKLSDTRIVILRKAEYDAAHVRPFDEVKDSIHDTLVAQAEQAAATDAAKAVASAIQGGKDPAEAVAGSGGVLSKQGWTGRRGQDLTPELSKTLFEMAIPAESKISTRVVPADGKVSLLVLRGDRAPSQDDMLKDDKGMAPIQSQLRDMHGGAEFEAYYGAAADAIGVTRNDDETAATEEQ